MNKESQLKELVKEKYSQIATQEKSSNETSCCGATCCSSNEIYNIMSEDYTNLEGYQPDADLGLGCGLPTEFAQIKEDDVVVDLGSGAGNDAFIARKLTGEKGKVIGIDFTEAMIEKAKANAEKLGFSNVQFRLGDIDNMPLVSDTANVIVSNCVLNLVPNKHKVFSEISRVLKPGGHFSISDIVLEGELPEKWKQVAELYAGCVAGAIQKSEYLDIITEAGFTNITLQKEKEITVPEDILHQYLAAEDVASFNNLKAKILSITVYAEKPAKDERKCCGPESSCC